MTTSQSESATREAAAALTGVETTARSLEAAAAEPATGIGAYSAGSTRCRPASSRSHLRWCRNAQPPVTVPRVMALIVPRVQKAA